MTDPTPIPCRQLGKVAAFVFRYMSEHGYIYPKYITCGYVYDDETEMLCAFIQAFPGRDPKNWDAAKRRLAKYLNQMTDDGWLEKSKSYNDQHYIGESASGWYPCYALPMWLIRDIDFDDETPESLAVRYDG